MNIRTWAWHAATAALSLGVLGCPRPETRPAPRPTPAGSGWNVLLLTIDTLRADHLGLYGYARATSPNIDALGRRAVVFEQAYTFWPKTRGSFAMMLTGRTPSQNGYSKKHPMVLGFNPTIASVLLESGYGTSGIVDNPNVAAQYGYDKGFEHYRETWLEPKALPTEMDRTRAITADGVRSLKAASGTRPFFLWLHYVNPHGPYEPPAPFDRKFMDAASTRGPRLEPVDGFHGGVRQEWAAGGGARPLGYYVALYDGEIAAVDAEIGQVLAALEQSGLAGRTLVVLTSDHGESLGEHDYYFDHGEDLFDPALRIPLLIAAPGARAGRSSQLASTLDLMPTILDAAKLSYPPGLSGQSLMPVVEGRTVRERVRLHAGNERNLAATFDRRFKLVATPATAGRSLSLYDREQDPGETRDLSRSQAEALRVLRREQELFFERSDREWTQTRVLVGDAPGEPAARRETCEALKALMYVDTCP